MPYGHNVHLHSTVTMYTSTLQSQCTPPFYSHNVHLHSCPIATIYTSTLQSQCTHPPMPYLATANMSTSNEASIKSTRWLTPTTLVYPATAIYQPGGLRGQSRVLTSHTQIQLAEVSVSSPALSQTLLTKDWITHGWFNLHCLLMPSHRPPQAAHTHTWLQQMAEGRPEATLSRHSPACGLLWTWCHITASTCFPNAGTMDSGQPSWKVTSRVIWHGALGTLWTARSKWIRQEMNRSSVGNKCTAWGVFVAAL